MFLIKRERGSITRKRINTEKAIKMNSGIIEIIIMIFSFVALLVWFRYIAAIDRIPRKPKEILRFSLYFVILVVLPLTMNIIFIIEYRYNFPKDQTEWKLNLVYLVTLIIGYIMFSFFKPIFWFLLGFQKKEKIVQNGLKLLKYYKENPSKNTKGFLRFLHRYFKVPPPPSEENIEAAIDEWIERLETEQAKIHALKDSRLTQNRKAD